MLIELLELVCSAILGALIGLDRTFYKKTAGIKTNSVVAFTACFIMVVISNAELADKLKVVGSIISGIGFLGAGVILKNDKKVQGLTTAATLWFSSTIGIACASDDTVILAITATIMFLFLLRFLSYIEIRFFDLEPNKGKKKISRKRKNEQ